MAQSNFTFINSIASVKPEMHTPYVQNWTLGLQREVARNLVVEARYVGNKSTHVWRTYSLSETNIFENGFLQEFINAQKNLAINLNAGMNSFQYRGLAGQSPLPILDAAFGARGSQPALAAGSSWTSSTFINQLRLGTAGTMADSLASGSNAQTYLCRMTGSNFPPCAPLGFNSAGPYPMNFFRHNPFVTGTTLLDDEQWSNYHGLQLEARRSFSNGLTANANYVWSKTLGDYFAVPNSDNSSNYTTLRNRGLDKHPSPFDLRHAVTVYWSYDLPFGGGHKFGGNANSLVKRVISDWTLGAVHRWNSGRAYMLTSGRGTFNQRDGGVILNGITAADLQNSIGVYHVGAARGGYVDEINPKFLTAAAGGTANPTYILPNTTAGAFGSIFYLYGPHQTFNDMSISKIFPIRDRLRFSFQSEFLNIFNHPTFGAPTGSILSTSFGHGSVSGSPRNIEFRGNIIF